MSMLEGSPNQFGGFVVNPGALPEDAGGSGGGWRMRWMIGRMLDIRWRGWRCPLRVRGLFLWLRRRGFGIITRMRIM